VTFKLLASRVDLLACELFWGLYESAENSRNREKVKGRIMKEESTFAPALRRDRGGRESQKEEPKLPNEDADRGIFKAHESRFYAAAAGVVKVADSRFA
jgi:hypothetical protein